MKRGEIWWAALPPPAGSGPGHRRPVVVVQSDGFNRSRIRTVVVAAVTSNLALAAAPGNLALPARGTGLRRASVVNVSQIVTLDRALLVAKAGAVPPDLRPALDAGLRLVLGLTAA